MQAQPSMLATHHRTASPVFSLLHPGLAKVSFEHLTCQFSVPNIMCVYCIVLHRGGCRSRQPRIKGTHCPSEEAGGSYGEAPGIWHATHQAGRAPSYSEAPHLHPGIAQVSHALPWSSVIYFASWHCPCCHAQHALGYQACIACLVSILQSCWSLLC